MLSLMRKHAKSFIIKILIAIIAFTFVLYFGFRFTDKEGAKVATVNGEVISKLEYDNTMHMMEEIQKAKNEKPLKIVDLRKRVMDDLITEKLISYEARAIGLDVTKKELQEHILSFPAFQNQGRFDEDRYRSLLTEKRMLPMDFENQQTQALLMKKVNQFLMTFAPLTEQELLDFYSFYNRKIKISFVQFPAEFFEKSVLIEPKALETYFNEHQETYRIPEKIKVAYLIIDPGSFDEKVEVKEEEISAYYEDHSALYKGKKQVKTRHILFRIEENASPEQIQQVRDKALEALKRIRAGEDFAKLAKELSEDMSAANGGLLDYFAEGQMNHNPYERAAFALKKGEVSEPVRTQFGYHILKVEDTKETKTKTLEEARAEIVQKLTQIARSDLAYEKALSLLDQMPYDIELPKYAQEMKLSFKETGFFALQETLADLGGTPKLNESLFELNKTDVSEVIELEKKYYIFQVLDRKESHLPALKEVQAQVEKAFRADQAKIKAKQEAEQYLARLKKGEAWNELVQSMKFPLVSTNLFSRQDAVPVFQNDPKLMDAAFELSQAKKYPDNIVINDQGAFLMQWEAEEGIDQVKFKAEMLLYRNFLQNSKTQVLATKWLNALKASARIEMTNIQENQ